MIIKSFLAFGAGFISFLTPCVLPIIPGYISYITGKNLNEIEQDKKNVLIKTILFSIGFSVVFIILGATASAIGNTHGVKKLINPAPNAKANFTII